MSNITHSIRIKINHIGINCQDIEKVSAFFVKYFEARVGAKYHNPRTGLHSLMLYLPDGGARLELMNYLRKLN